MRKPKRALLTWFAVAAGWAPFVTAGCQRALPPAPKPAREPPPERASAAPSSPEAAPPPGDRRCESARPSPSHNVTVVIADADPKLSAALDRPPPDAAAEWADTLRQLAKNCREAAIEHALPSQRVTLEIPSGCKAGAPAQRLVLDFRPKGSGSALTVKGSLVVDGRPVAVEANVDKSSEPTALCAFGKLALGGEQMPTPAREKPKDERNAAVERQRWLSLPFHVVGGILGLIPRER